MTPSSNGSIELGLEGKTAIVTGASSGFGVAIACQLAGAGARVVAVGRDSGRLTETVKAIRDGGGTSLAIVEDLTSKGASERIVEAAVREYGEIDVLVNNAGIFHQAPLVELTDEQYEQMMAINLRAPFQLTRAAVPHMPAGSSIVFVGSNLVHHGYQGMSIYSASKAAIEVLSRVLAVELGGQGIRVNAVSPGPTRTPMTRGITENPELEAMVIGNTPVGRMGEVEDIANAICFLASGAASGYVSGAVLLIDGGQVA